MYSFDCIKNQCKYSIKLFFKGWKCLRMMQRSSCRSQQLSHTQVCVLLLSCHIDHRSCKYDTLMTFSKHTLKTQNVALDFPGIHFYKYFFIYIYIFKSWKYKRENVRFYGRVCTKSIKTHHRNLPTITTVNLLKNDTSYLLSDYSYI